MVVVLKSISVEELVRSVVTSLKKDSNTGVFL